VAKTLYLVRHGECEGASPGMLVGRTDLALSEEGRRRSAALRGALPWQEGVRVVCSPLRRAQETAVLAWVGASPHDPPGPDRTGLLPDEIRGGLEIDPDLAEIDFGEWEGRLFPELEAQYPELVAAWSQFRRDFVFPGGEGLAGFASRVRRAAQRLAAGDDSPVIAFTHGGVIRALICHYLGLPLRHYLLFDVAPASVTTLRLWGEKGVLSGLFAGDDLGVSSEGWAWRRSSL
jgi:broad specificity phosphatase PhoE